MIVIVLTLGAYAAIRFVSLHLIDAIIHRRQMAGARYGTVLEYALLAVAGACALWTPRRKDRPVDDVAPVRIEPATERR